MGYGLAPVRRPFGPEGRREADMLLLGWDGNAPAPCLLDHGRGSLASETKAFGEVRRVLSAACVLVDDHAEPNVYEVRSGSLAEQVGKAQGCLQVVNATDSVGGFCD